MKKSFLLYIATLLLGCTLVVSSCKKPVHSNVPTPNNVRMLSYSKVTTIEFRVPVAGVPSTINENYRFYYNAANKVSKMIYTGNDSFQFHKVIDFEYRKDSVFKTTTNALTNQIVERDTFIMNSNGQLITAFTPNTINEYEYYGKLLARNKRSARSWRNISMSTQSTYTSVNGDFLEHNSDNRLTTEIYDMTTPLKHLAFLQWAPTTFAPIVDTVFGYNSLVNVRDGYNFKDIYLHVLDDLGRKDSLIYYGQPWINEDYHFYTEMANRPGDYMQIQSFTQFGTNIFQNSHLVENITSRNLSTKAEYNIDAYSNIIQTTAVTVDSVLNKYTEVYDIQYETF